MLAGPTMDLDGPVRLYRWHGAVLARDADVIRGEGISRVGELPYGEGEDHAEVSRCCPKPMTSQKFSWSTTVRQSLGESVTATFLPTS